MSNKQLVPVNLYASASNPTVPSPQTGDVYYNTTTGVLVYNGTQWVATGGSAAFVQTTMPSSPTNGSIWLDTDGTSTVVLQQLWRKAVTSNTTTFSGNDDFSLSLSYTVGYEQVYLNGVLLVRDVDYTASNGTSVTLNTVANAGDYVEIISTATFVAANTYTQAQANAAFYPVTTTQIAGKNKIINGDFTIAQRGTSFTFAAPTSGGFTLDQWRYLCDDSGGSSGSKTISQVAFTPGNTIAGYEPSYFIRVNSTVASTTETYSFLTQWIEDVRTFAGQTATFSFWAKAAANTTLPSFQIRQNFGTGGSANVDTVIATNIALTTSWQRFTFTFTVPSIAGKTVNANSYLRVGIFNPLRATYTTDFWGVQLEAGSVATQFTTASGTIQGELALCQRYYFRLNATDVYTRWAPAIGQNGTSVQAVLTYPVQMRTKPTSLDYSNLAVYDTATVINVTSASFTDGGVNSTYVQLNVASGVTQYRPYQLLAGNNASAYIGFSAEL